MKVVEHQETPWGLVPVPLMRCNWCARTLMGGGPYPPEWLHVEVNVVSFGQNDEPMDFCCRGHAAAYLAAKDVPLGAQVHGRSQ